MKVTLHSSKPREVIDLGDEQIGSGSFSVVFKQGADVYYLTHHRDTSKLYLRACDNPHITKFEYIGRTRCKHGEYGEEELCLVFKSPYLESLDGEDTSLDRKTYKGIVAAIQEADNSAHWNLDTVDRIKKAFVLLPSKLKKHGITGELASAVMTVCGLRVKHGLHRFIWDYGMFNFKKDHNGTILLHDLLFPN